MESASNGGGTGHKLPLLVAEDNVSSVRELASLRIGGFFTACWKRLLLVYWYLIISRAQVDSNAKCPSCGHRDGEIRFDYNFVWPDGTKGAIIHSCHIDRAVWAEKPIIKAEQWHVEGLLLEEEVRSDTPVINKPEPRTRGKKGKPAFKTQ